MSKRPGVTIYWYSQTGQLQEVVAALVAPLEKADWQVDWVEIKPLTDFPFPWPLGRFFGIFPDAVDPSASVELSEMPPAPDGELVLLAFQVWYLAPSLPMRSVLRTMSGAFDGRDVIGVIACRNMWYSAAVEAQRAVTASGARYVGTVAATDTAPALTTFVTTLRWLLTGRREAFWRFPRAGVGNDELTRLRVLGEHLAALNVSARSLGDHAREVLADQGAAPVAPQLAAADLAAGRLFRTWGKVIRAVARRGSAQRAALLGLFVTALVCSIVLGLPAMAVLRRLNRARFDEKVHRSLAPVLASSSKVKS